jgi:DNA-directed RNA polymerase specialized sigma subunit
VIYIDSIEGLDHFVEYALPMPDMEGDIDRAACRQWLQKTFRRLSRQQRLVIRRLLNGERQIDVGRALGLTQARISQIVREAVQELQRKLPSRYR